jgi:hypothetical protein
MQRQELLTTLVLANACKEGELRLGGSHDAQGRANARQVLAALAGRWRWHPELDMPLPPPSVASISTANGRR